MAQYAQNTTTGHTCPWGSADDNLPPDAFTLAARKAAAKRRDSQDSNSSSVVLAHTPACLAAAGAGYNTGRTVEKDEVKESVAFSTNRSSVKSGGYDGKATGRCTTSLKAKEVELEKKMMDLINQCLDKKVLELRQPPKAADDRASVGSSTARSEAVSTARSSQIETTRTAREQATKPNVSKAKNIEKGGYEALERYPALLKEMKGLSASKEVPEGLTSTGKQKQAMKLSEASLGKFDADESRLAYLEMQKSAAEARNKNRSALCFGDDTGNAGPAAAHKDVTMAEKRDKAKKLSDASLGKFDADQSQIAYLDMQNTAAEMRAKNRVGQGIF